jgi:hypothetical protein
MAGLGGLTPFPRQAPSDVADVLRPLAMQLYRPRRAWATGRTAIGCKKLMGVNFLHEHGALRRIGVNDATRYSRCGTRPRLKDSYSISMNQLR